MVFFWGGGPERGLGTGPLEQIWTLSGCLVFQKKKKEANWGTFFPTDVPNAASSVRTSDLTDTMWLFFYQNVAGNAFST